MPCNCCLYFVCFDYELLITLFPWYNYEGNFHLKYFHGLFFSFNNDSFLIFEIKEGKSLFSKMQLQVSFFNKFID